MSAPKHQKLSSMDQQYLVELLVDKDKEVKKVLRLAREQAKIEKKMTVLRTKVDSLVSIISYCIGRHYPEIVSTM